MMHKQFVNKKPWTMMGDFDVALNIEDISRDIGNIKKQDEFKECVH